MSSLFPFLCFLHFNTYVQARVRVRRKKTKTIRVKRKKSGTIAALAGDIEEEEGSKDGGLLVSPTEEKAEEEAVEDEGKRTHMDETRSNEKRRQEKIEDEDKTTHMEREEMHGNNNKVDQDRPAAAALPSDSQWESPV